MWNEGVTKRDTYDSDYLNTKSFKYIKNGKGCFSVHSYWRKIYKRI